MVAPLVVMGAIAAGSAIAQWMNSESARNASSAERAQMQELLSRVQEPDFDFSEITPELYSVVGKYVPEASNFISENNPTLVKADSAGAKLGRDAQVDALSAMRERAKTGTDASSRALQQEAMNAQGVANQGQQGAIRDEFARRGQSGNGMELIARISGQEAAAQQGAQQSRNAVLDAQRERLQSMRDSANLGGQIRNEDVDVEWKNAGVINDFNSRTATRRQAFDNRGVDDRNEAQRSNLNVAQGVASQNTTLRNQTAVSERNRRDELKQRIYNNSMQKLGVNTTQSQGRIDGINGQATDTNKAIGGIAGGVISGIAATPAAAKSPSTPAVAPLTVGQREMTEEEKLQFRSKV